jgi:uncharacterized protein YlxW (UPF0749 family)
LRRPYKALIEEKRIQGGEGCLICRHRLHYLPDGLAKVAGQTTTQQWSATMPQYADDIRGQRLINEAQLKISECRRKIRELKKTIKDAKVEINELEAVIEQLSESH